MDFTLKNSDNLKSILALKGHILLASIEMKKGNIESLTLNFNFDNENIITDRTKRIPLNTLQKKANGNMYYFDVGKNGKTTFPKISSTNPTDKHIYISATSQDDFEFVVYYGF